MSPITVTESLGGLTGFFVTFVAALLLTGLFVLVYIRITPFPEFALIRDGKSAPAVSFSGALLGFVIPLASVIVHSIDFLDMVVWAMVALIIQILVYLVLKACLPNLAAEIAADRLAPALLLATLSLAAGILNAACMSY